MLTVVVILKEPGTYSYSRLVMLDRAGDLPSLVILQHCSRRPLTPFTFRRPGYARDIHKFELNIK